MGSDILVLLLILSFGMTVFFIVSTLFGQSTDKKLLAWASGNEPEKSDSPLIELSRSLCHQFTLPYTHFIKSPSYRKGIEKKLLVSGLNSELNVDEFIGIQLLWGVLFPVITIILNFALSLEYPWFVFVLMIPTGFMLPHFHANTMRSKRVTSVLVELPFFVDLLALSTEAGLDFQGSLQKIVEKTDENSALSEELNTVLKDIALGNSRAEALRAMARRLDLTEMNSVVNVIIDSDSTGTPVSEVLKEQSVQMRLERFVRAEKEGAKASQKILFPLLLFIVPAVFIMILAPVALQFLYGGV